MLSQLSPDRLLLRAVVFTLSHAPHLFPKMLAAIVFVLCQERFMGILVDVIWIDAHQQIIGCIIPPALKTSLQPHGKKSKRNILAEARNKLVKFCIIVQHLLGCFTIQLTSFFDLHNTFLMTRSDDIVDRSNVCTCNHLVLLCCRNLGVRHIQVRDDGATRAKKAASAACCSWLI